MTTPAPQHAITPAAAVRGRIEASLLAVGVDAARAAPSWRAGGALFAAGALATFALNAQLFLYPVAAFEDGTEGLGRALTQGAPVIHFYQGFVQFIPDLVYYAGTFLPLPAAPYLYAWTALAIAACLLPAIYCALRTLLRVPPVPAACIALLVPLLPLEDWPLLCTMDYAIWPLAAMLCLTALAAAPTGPATAWFVAWRLAAMWSNPLGLLTAPIWLGRALLGGAWGRLPSLLLLAGACLYAALGLAPAGTHSASMGHTFILSARMALQSALSGLLPLRALFDPLPTAALLPLALLIIASLTHLRRRLGAPAPQAWLAATALAYLMLGACALCAAGRAAARGDTYVLTGVRYLLLPKLCWLLLLGALSAEIIAHGARPQRIALAGGLAALLPLAVLVSFPPRAYDTRDEGRSLRAFLQNAQTALRQGNPGPFRHDRVGPAGDWSVVIDTRPIR